MNINELEKPLRIIASARSWVEGNAVRQLSAAMKLPGIRRAVGFPDLHPGKNGPVGAAFVSEGWIHPTLIGGDIGCGMALFKTSLAQRDIQLNRWMDAPFNLEHAWEGDARAELSNIGLEPGAFDGALGTLGGGNHFAELQQTHEVFDTDAFERFGLEKRDLVLLVHSGSRGFGEAVLRGIVDRCQGRGIEADSAEAESYLDSHDKAVRWARLSRRVLAGRFSGALRAEARCLWDGCHNSITPGPEPGTWIHRKGAVEDAGMPVVIPGSRGALSYLVQPVGDAGDRAASLAHGAGRKWARSEARLRMRERFRIHELMHTAFGGRVICEERDLLYEEAPAAYKDITRVIADLTEAGCISVIATFRPLITYKTRAVRR
jgi:release factor H-coupled RctB family protein